MVRIADACARLSQAAAEKKHAHVQPDTSGRGFEELEKRWNAAEREADQAKRDMKKMRAEVESLWKKADATGWGVTPPFVFLPDDPVARLNGLITHKL